VSEYYSFDNQQGIESAILGLGLNQNNVEACPKLKIFEEAINRISLVNRDRTKLFILLAKYI
jgi:hypothetical protein